jgi:hypothetical protein
LDFANHPYLCKGLNLIFNSLKKNIKPQAQPAFSLVPESTILIGPVVSEKKFFE